VVASSVLLKFVFDKVYLRIRQAAEESGCAENGRDNVLVCHMLRQEVELSPLQRDSVMSLNSRQTIGTTEWARVS
jgi:hypothetical protein